MLDPNFKQPYTYTSREYDEETGLYFYRARYYDSTIGMFITEDPIGLLGGINLFAYVANNPMNFTDPLGLAPHEKFIAQLAKYTDKGIRSAIRNFQRKIAKHKEALTDSKQCRDIPHHEHELRVFKEQLKLAEREAAKRGLLGTGASSFAEDITEEEAEKRTGSLFDWVDPFLSPGYAY